jgi:CBS domain-containing protein
VDDTDQPVKSAMEQPFVTARPSTSRAAVAELLRGDIGTVLLTDGDTGNVQGIITKFDLIWAKQLIHLYYPTEHRAKEEGLSEL